jgi:hypothetical protein
MAVLAVLLLALLGACPPRSDDTRVQTQPREIAADDIAAALRRMPPTVGLSFSGVVFFRDRLYLAANAGLFVVNNGRIEKLYQWSGRDPVIEGPWIDRPGSALWFQHARDGSLTRFDGANWQPIALPPPPGGDYYSRGDMLTGFLGLSSPQQYWIVGGGHAWRWGLDSRWVPVPELPAAAVPQSSAIRAVAPVEGGLLYVVRLGHEVIPPSPYAVYDSGRAWASMQIAERMDFREAALTAEALYVRAQDGRLFAIARGSVRAVPTPGPCEAIARTDSDRLIASFTGRGIFALEGGKWVRRAESPYGPEEGEHWAHLAENRGLLAYATTTVPHLDRPDTGTVALWLGRGPKLVRVPLN